MRVLIVGQGGREHAIAAALGRSPTVDRMYAAPGNAGLAELATCVPIAAADVRGLAEFAERETIGLTVVGPETPLVAGLVDELEARGLPVFGPGRDAARIEGSKVWAKGLCERHGIPVAASRSFTDFGEAREYLDTLHPPYVVKADGLAAGKGVTVADDLRGAVAALQASLVDRAFGAAGTRVLVEEYLEGREISVLAISDGREVRPLPPAQDYKRLDDGDAGPNTGGMGAYSPVPFVGDATHRGIVQDILIRALRGMESEGMRYRGVLYAGLMLTAGGPRVLEFNCRFGDPETQAILPRLTSDLGEALLACVEGNLGPYRLRWSPQACVSVVLASEGYPTEPRTGFPVQGLDEVRNLEGVQVFHAGTALRDGRVTTAGGRVLTVSAMGPDIAAARARAYEACALVSFDGMRYRRDIAADVSGSGDG